MAESVVPLKLSAPARASAEAKASLVGGDPPPVKPMLWSTVGMAPVPAKRAIATTASRLSPTMPNPNRRVGRSRQILESLADLQHCAPHSHDGWIMVTPLLVE